MNDIKGINDLIEAIETHVELEYEKPDYCLYLSLIHI